MDTLDSLSGSQRETLASFQAITATDDLDTALVLLNSTSWDLSAAISKIYDREPGPPVASTSESEATPLMEEFGIDDSRVMPPSGGEGPRNTNLSFWLRQFFAVPVNVLSWPVGVLYGAAGYVLGFLARLLRIRPGAPSLRPRNPFARDPNARSSRLDRTSSSERWLRSLEETTGRVRWGRRDEGSSSSSAVGGAREGLRERGTAGTLVDFWVGGYEEAVRRAKDEVKVLMVVLTCEENDDDLEFKRSVLTDADLAKYLSAQGVLCWGGDIRDRDAYQVSKTLSYFSLPFIAFIALQPPSGTSSSTPRMTVISRLEGSPLTTTSAPHILSHLSTFVLPRVNPFLARLRGQESVRRAERQLREEQDRAYNVAAARDTERVLKMRREESEKKRVRAVEEKKEEEVRRVREGSRAWRGWMRGVMSQEGEPEEGEGVARIVVRLGDGRRAVRRFRGTDRIEKIYAFVECALSEVEDNKDPSTSTSSKPPVGYNHIFEFRLATTLPRVVLEIDGGAGEKEVRELGGTLVPLGNLVVEGLEKRRISLGEDLGSGDEEEEEEEE